MSSSTFPTAISVPPGIVFRHLQAPDDYVAMNAVANAMRAADGHDWATSDDQFRTFYENLPNCDPARDILVAERDGRVVGYGRTGWAQGLDGVRVYEPVAYVDPADATPGLLDTIHDAMEARIREIAADHPSGPKAMSLEVAETSEARTALLRARGYEPVRYEYTMVRPTLDDLPDAPLPEGLEIRDVEPADLRAIWEAEIEAFRDHWGSTEPTESEYRLWVDDPVQGDTSLWRVAWDGDQVAGMVRSYINETENERYRRRRGWVENISVRRPWRRRGLARALIAASFPLLRERGMTEGALGVDTENPSGALRLYESCGFVPVRRSVILQKRFE